MAAFINLDNLGTAWEQAREYLRDDLLQFAASVNQYLTVSHNQEGEQRAASRGSIIGQLIGTLAEQPTGLGAADNGLLYFVSDYSALVRWDGATWQLAPGTVTPGKIEMFAAAPPTAAGYVLCNGAATSYLSGFGTATLTFTNITLPDLTGSGAYLETGASYTGSVVAASGGSLTGSTAGGSTGTGSTGTGTTGSVGDHNHSMTTSPPNRTATAVFWTTEPAFVNAADEFHTHTGTTSNAGGHSHSVPSLSVPSLSIPALGAGTLAVDASAKPRHLVLLPYFKR